MTQTNTNTQSGTPDEDSYIPAIHESQEALQESPSEAPEEYADVSQIQSELREDMQELELPGVKILDEKPLQREIDCQSIDDCIQRLRMMGELLMTDLDKVINSIRQESDASKTKKACLKSPQRAKVKITNHYGGDSLQNTDFLRGTLVYNDLAKLQNGIESLKKQGLIEAVRIKPRIGDINSPSPHPRGYRDIQAQVVFPNGYVAEIQFHIDTLFEAKTKGIVLPEQLLTGFFLSDDEKDLIRNIHQVIGDDSEPEFDTTKKIPTDYLYKLSRAIPSPGLKDYETKRKKYQLLQAKIDTFHQIINEYAWQQHLNQFK